ncbi:MAG TPA: TCR/Tet family MFS transporter [bacterium]|nr:TCR/Tet family MFS transporter [bacterium]
MADTTPPSPAHKSALTFIFITLLIDVTGLGLIIPVLPKLIQELTHGSMSEAARWGGWLGFAYAALQFLFAPVLGGLSDRFGRRPVLLFSLVGFGLDYLLQGFAPTIGWLFLGRCIAGITGASFTAASAYIADITPPEKRAQNFGLIGAAFGMGFILGPAAGGLLGEYGPRVPFFAAAALALLNALYGYFILPESLDEVHRRPFEWRRANPVGSLLQMRRYPVIISLITSLFLLYVAAHAAQTTWAYFTMERFKWSEKEVGFSLAFVGLVIGAVQGGLTRVVIPRLGQNRAVIVGFVFWLTGLLCFAFATKGWMMYAFMIPYGLGGIAGPALQGIISSSVPPNEQGELQGAMTSLVSVTSIIGPLLMTNLFAHYTRPGAPIYFPGAPFLMGAVLTVISTLLVARSLRKHAPTPEPVSVA